MTPKGHCPKSSRTLKHLAKAGSAWNSHVHCAAPWGLGVDHRLAPELFAGTSKTITFYKGYTMAIEPWYNITFYKVFEQFAGFLDRCVQRLLITRDMLVMTTGIRNANYWDVSCRQTRKDTK